MINNNFSMHVPAYHEPSRQMHISAVEADVVDLGRLAMFRQEKKFRKFLFALS